MSITNMAILKIELPPHCQIKPRAGGKYHDVYFMPRLGYRPKDWPSTIHLGRTDKNSAKEIIALAQSTYKEYMDCMTGVVQAFPSSKAGTLTDICDKYRNSGFYEDISERTQKDYECYLKEIEKWSAAAGHPHIKELTTQAIVKWLKRYEDTPIAQRRAKTVLSILYKTALNEGLVEINLCTGIALRRRKTEKRKLVIWEDDDVSAFVKAADEAGHPSVGRALIMALETAQRRGDVLRMQQPRDYDPKAARLKFNQSKTGKLVSIKATERLQKALSAIPMTQMPLFVNENTGKPWQADVFTHSFREIADMAGLKNHIFAHTRHSAILYLHRAGVSEKGIASITGHSLKTVSQMLENHYLETRDQEVADNAIAQLEEYRKGKF